MTESKFMVTNLHLIGFRVVQRLIERSNILSQLWSLQAFSIDPVLSVAAFIEEVVPDGNGGQKTVGSPRTLTTAKTELTEQLDANTSILRQLVQAFREEKRALEAPAPTPQEA